MNSNLTPREVSENEPEDGDQTIMRLRGENERLTAELAEARKLAEESGAALADWKTIAQLGCQALMHRVNGIIDLDIEQELWTHPTLTGSPRDPALQKRIRALKPSGAAGTTA